MDVTTVRDTLTVTQVASRLGLHRATVYAMLRENRFPVRPLPLPQRRKLFSKAAVDRFLEDAR